MATHKILSRDSFEETAYLELAKTYLKMGRLENALAEYKILAQHYASWGMKDKAARVMALMARIDSSKAGPPKEIKGLKPPINLKALEAARNGPEEAGNREASIDDSIEQFQTAYEKNQNVSGSSHSLGSCFKKKSQGEEAHPALAKASRADGISRDIKSAAKCQLALILKEQGKLEEAFDLLGEVYTGRPGISQYQRSNRQADRKINEGGKAPAQFCRSTEFDRESQTQKGLGPGKNNQKKKNSRDRKEYYCFYLLCSILLWLIQNQFCLNN
jgi:tetratricopeptide (TPR) repeat protein